MQYEGLRYYIQGDQKVPVHLMIAIKLQEMFKLCPPASLQTFIDTPNCAVEDPA